jgi:MFS family permease
VCECVCQVECLLANQALVWQYAGFVIGALAGGYLGDIFGRKTMLYVHAAIFLPCNMSAALSMSAMQLMVSVNFPNNIVLCQSPL